MKVLLFTNDLMPFGGLPTAGAGSRCWQLKLGLEARGIEVVSSMPSFNQAVSEARDKIPPESLELLWNHEEQQDVISKVRPDALLFSSGWDHMELVNKPEIPLIIDLQGSPVTEQELREHPESSERKLTVFSKADCLLAADSQQRSYFYGWLVQAGRVPELEHAIRCVPLSGEDATDPLADFLRNPQVLAESVPAHGSVYAKRDYVCARGASGSVSMKISEVLEQHFVVPEEHTASVEIELSQSPAASKYPEAAVVCELRRPQGKVLTTKRCLLADLPTDGRFLLAFPALFAPVGGEELVMALKLEGLAQETEALLSVPTLAESHFPLIRGEKASGFLALSFTPGDQSAVYRARVLAKRAVWLMKRGEWRRVAWAVRKRVPMLGAFVRQKLRAALGS